MNKTELLSLLLSCCNESHIALFNRMYPGGPAPKKLNRAIEQVIQTVKGLSDKLLEARRDRDSATAEMLALKDALSGLKKIIETKEDAIKVQAIKISTLESNADPNCERIKKRLAILDALEAGGVDNWEWFGESLNNAGVEYCF